MTKEKVDAIEIEYGQSRSTNIQPIFEKFNKLMKPLLKNNSFQANVRRG